MPNSWLIAGLTCFQRVWGFLSHAMSVAKHKTVLVHRCYNQQLEMRPEHCTCAWWVTMHDAEDQIAGGQAEWVMMQTRTGRFVPAYLLGKPEIVRLNRKPHCENSRAVTIEEKEMQAMAGLHGSFAKRYHAKRAEIYNALTEAMKARLGAVLRPRLAPGG